MELTFDSELPLSVPWPGFRARYRQGLFSSKGLLKISGFRLYLRFRERLGLGERFAKVLRLRILQTLGPRLWDLRSQVQALRHICQCPGCFRVHVKQQFLAFGWTRKPKKGETSTQIQKKRKSNTTNQTKPPFRKPPIKIPPPRP